MIGTICIGLNAAHPNIPLATSYTVKGSPSSFRITEVPTKIGNWKIEEVLVSVVTPDNEQLTAQCKKVGDIWVGTIEGTTRTGEVKNGVMITANGIDENGDAVRGYVLGMGDFIVIDKITDASEVESISFLRLFNDRPETPIDNDAVFDDGVLSVFKDGEWTSTPDASEFVKESDLEGYVKKSDLYGYAKFKIISDNAEIPLDYNTWYFNSTSDIYQLTYNGSTYRASGSPLYKGTIFRLQAVHPQGNYISMTSPMAGANGMSYSFNKV